MSAPPGAASGVPAGIAGPAMPAPPGAASGVPAGAAMPAVPAEQATLPCSACLRRNWLLGACAGHIEHLRHRAADLLALLELDDEQLLQLTERSGRRDALEPEYEALDLELLRDRCRRAAITAICSHDERYPPLLAALRAAPAVLFLAGAPARLAALLAQPAAALVGARRASPDALEVARGLGRGLSAATVTVISGMAHGVDSAAHAGALEAGAATIAVLAGPPDRAYPAAKRPLHRRLVEDAAVISEWPPGFAPRPWCFTARNRIIAGLALATIIVEAGERSGSLTTAAFAVDFNRTLGAVPGRVTAAASAGSNALLFDGAHVVRDAQDALELACVHGAAALPPADHARVRGLGARRERAPAPALSRRLRRALEAVEEGREAQGSLFGPAGAVDLLADLAQLELLGLVRRAPGGGYVRCA